MSVVSQLTPGSVFARDFRIVARLAEGGMGAVYVAEQLSTGKRRAVKVMLPDLVSNPKARQRFELEARIAGQIESEHVVEVVGAGVDDATGTPWLAMELLEGQDLGTVVRNVGRIPPDEVFVAFQQLGHALSAAHRRGIVHRDLKPENLFLAASHRVGAPFRLKVLDFGIAKITQESRATQHRTAAMGSPLWMAPEQTEEAHLTPATDVWALGLIAFYLLIGKSYWRSANHPEGHLASVLTELLVSPLDPASVRAAQLGALEPLPAGFDGWFSRCVARDPAQRFPDAGAAVAALGPGMRGADARRDASQPFSTHTPSPRIAATVALSSFGAASPVGSLPPTSQVPISVGSSSSAVPQMNYPPVAQAPAPQTPAQLTPAASLSLGRVLAYGAALVAALGCTAGMTFGALHVVQAFGPGARSHLPPPLLVDAPRSDAGAPSFDAGAPQSPDAGLDAGRRVRTPEIAAEAGGAREFAWADGEAHVFRGTGRFTSGIVCDFTLTLNRNGSTVDGFFHWTVREVPPTAAGALTVGEESDEGVTGTWAAPACNIHTVGAAAGTSIRLTISGEGRLSGRDDGGTRYSGRLSR